MVKDTDEIIYKNTRYTKTQKTVEEIKVKEGEDPYDPEKIRNLSYLSPYIDSSKPKAKPVKKVFTLQINKKTEKS